MEKNLIVGPTKRNAVQYAHAHIHGQQRRSTAALCLADRETCQLIPRAYAKRPKGRGNCFVPSADNKRISISRHKSVPFSPSRPLTSSCVNKQGKSHLQDIPGMPSRAPRRLRRAPFSFGFRFDVEHNKVRSAYSHVEHAGWLKWYYKWPES